MPKHYYISVEYFDTDEAAEYLGVSPVILNWYLTVGPVIPYFMRVGLHGAEGPFYVRDDLEEHTECLIDETQGFE